MTVRSQPGGTFTLAAMAAPMAVPSLEGEPGSQGNRSNDLFYKKKEVQKHLDLSFIGLKKGLRTKKGNLFDLIPHSSCCDFIRRTTRNQEAWTLRDTNIVCFLRCNGVSNWWVSIGCSVS